MNTAKRGTTARTLCECLIDDQLSTLSSFLLSLHILMYTSPGTFFPAESFFCGLLILLYYPSRSLLLSVISCTCT